MRALPRALALAALLATASPTQPASAQDASAPETDRARELHRAGDAAFQAGKFEEARTAYLAAWALKKHWQIATNLGDAEARTGRHRDAAEHLAHALRIGAAEMTDAQKAGVQKALDDAKKHVAQVDLEIAPDGADVVVDGAFVGRSPLPDPVFLEPGEHTVEVKKVGYLARSEQVDATAGAATALRVELLAEGAGAAPPGDGVAPMQPPVEGGDDGPGVAPWILIGGGAALAIGGGVLLGVGLGEQSSGSDLLSSVQADGGRCEPASAGFEARCDDAFGAESTGNTLAGVGTAFLIGGGAAMAGGIVWMLIADGSGSGETTGFAPVLSPQTSGVTAWGRF